MKIYPYYLDVTAHTDYERRPVRVPSWEDFANNTQFFIELVHAQRDGRMFDLQRELDLYIDTHKLGTVMAPYAYNLFADNLEELLEQYRRRGLSMAHIWGFVPLVNPESEGYGHLDFTRKILGLCKDGLGKSFFGMGNGEQDGRYFGTYAPGVCPGELERTAQYAQFHAFARRLIEDLGGMTTDICSLSSGYYFLREGRTTLTQAETAQALPNAQVYYAMLRGAGKRFGVLWSAGDSVFNKWGFKGYSLERPDENFMTGYGFGPEKGTSLSLLKRLTWLHVLHNAAFTGFEINYIVGDSLQERTRSLGEPGEDGVRQVLPIDYTRPQLSPIGKLQSQARAIVQKRGRAGVHIAPLGLLLDFYAGWAMPRHLYSKSVYQVWGDIPYNSGDYLTHSLLDMLYPGYVDSGYYHDERGFIAPTPFGDIADILLSDAPAWCLRQYDTLVVAGELTCMLAEVRDKLLEYVTGGGKLILTGQNAAALGRVLSGVRFNGEKLVFDAGSEVSFADTSIEEPLCFDLLACQTDENVRVLADCQGSPAVVCHDLGAGSVTTLLSPFGLQRDRLIDGPIGNRDDCPLPNPYVLTETVRHLFTQVFGNLRLFSAGDDLALTVSRQRPGRYEALVLNNDMREKPLCLRSCIGRILDIREVELGEDLSGERGYKPERYADRDLGRDTAHTIAGLSARMFEITLEREQTTPLAPIIPDAPPRGRALALRRPADLEREVLLRPSFSQHFDAVTLSWRYVLEHDVAVLKKQAQWLHDQAVSIIVDFSDGMNAYPDLLLNDSYPPLWHESRASIGRVFEKMGQIGAVDAICTPTFSVCSAEEAVQSFKRLTAELCDDAVRYGIRIHMQSNMHRMRLDSMHLLRVLREIGKDNLRCCLNISHLLLQGEDPAQALREAGADCEIVLFSAVYTDAYGQVYDAHLPLVGSSYKAQTTQWLAAAGDRRIVLDAVYQSQDAEYLDNRLLSGKGVVEDAAMGRTRKHPAAKP